MSDRTQTVRAYAFNVATNSRQEIARTPGASADEVTATRGGRCTTSFSTILRAVDRRGQAAARRSIERAMSGATVREAFASMRLMPPPRASVRIVLDTNVVFSGLPLHGTAHRLLTAIRQSPETKLTDFGRSV